MMPSTMLLPLRVCSGTKGQLYSPLEWDEQRQEIQKLYITQNRTLEEVVAIMGRRGFKASAKQFRDRLKRWRLTKYRKGTDISKLNPPSTGGKDDDRKACVVGPSRVKTRSVKVYNVLQTIPSHETRVEPSERVGVTPNCSLRVGLLHANNASRHVHTVVVSAYNYMAASFEHEISWQAVDQGRLVGGYEHPFIQEIFQRAILSYAKYPSDVAAFGRMTRQAFLEAERLLAHARPQMTLLTLFYVPWLLAWKHHVGICVMYLQHICSLLQQRQCGHSLLAVGQAVQDLLLDGHRSGKLDVEEFLSSLADIVQAWMECYNSMDPRDKFPDQPSHTHMWMEACTEFMRGKHPRDIIDASLFGVKGLGTLSTAFRTSSDNNHDVAIQLEADLTLLQAISYSFLDSFEESAHNILKRAGTSPSMEDTRLSCWRALADHCEARRDWVRVIAYREMCCEVSGDRRDVYLLFELEQKLRRIGREELADETGRKRRSFEVRLGLRDFEWRGTTWDQSSVMMTLLSRF